jgi:hypothetical protein
LRLRRILIGLLVFAAAFAAGSLLRVDQLPAARMLRTRLSLIDPITFPAGDTLLIADTLRARCGGAVGSRKEPCYTAQLLALREQRGTRFAMGTLHRLTALDNEVSIIGHDYSHMIGIAAFKADHDVSASFKSCTEILQSGCYHGVIQTYLLSVPSVNDTAVNAVCREWSTPDGDRWLRFQCVHGMGHGLEMIYAHDLPRALQGCDLLGEEWDQKSCYGGAFMENIVYASDPSMAKMVMGDTKPMAGMAMDDHHGASSAYKMVDHADPFFPCSQLGDRYQDDCWQMQPAVILYLNHGDYAQTFATCDKAPAAYRATCYQGTGTSISGGSNRNHGEAITLCSRGSARYQPWCYEGVVKNFIDVTADYRDGMAFCKVVPGRANQLKCYMSVGEELAVLRNDPAARRPACDGIGSDRGFVDACLYGAQLIVKPPKGMPVAL